MKQIKCSNCKKIVKDCIYLLLPVACRYELRVGHIASKAYSLPGRHIPKYAIGYVCSFCDKKFPDKWNERIAKYLKARRVLNELKS